MKQFSFELEPVSPFRLDLTAWVLRRRPDNIVDRWDGKHYRRVVVIGEHATEIAAKQNGTADAPRVHITLTCDTLPSNAKSSATTALERLLGLSADLTDFYRFASQDRRLMPLMQHFKGLKPPRFLTTYEALVNGITCQQLTLTFGITVLNRLATRFGRTLQTPHGPAYAFPRPADLVDAEPEALRKLAYSRQKARALIELSRGIVDGRIVLENLESMTDETALKYLDDLRGVGRWTSEYVLLRGLGRLHVFPADDVGVRRSLERWLKLEKLLDYETTNRLLARWKPYAGLIYFHLLLNGLMLGGYIQ